MKMRKLIIIPLIVVLLSAISFTESIARPWQRRPSLMDLALADVPEPVILAIAHPAGGYGEYAEYGPWSRSNRRAAVGCYPARLPVWAGTGWLFRRIQVCR
jgi:hypothetical protein